MVRNNNSSNSNTASSLLGNRGRALYPPRNFQPALQNRRGTNNNHNGESTNASDYALSFFSRQSLMILTIGILIGYLMLPVLLVNHLGNGNPVGFDTIQMNTSRNKHKLKINDINQIGPIPISNKHAEPSRYLSQEDKEQQQETEHPNQDTPKHDTTQAQDPVTQTKPPESTPQQTDESSSQDETASAAPPQTTDAVATDSKEQPNEPNFQEQVKQEEANDKPSLSPIPEKQAEPLDDVSQRIIEQQETLSKQSIPTITTPYIMKTNALPDHLRMKILITGGAGFVGSHLVDKLMMEGHEVIVADNFFTGQKKNIAHWLHHPNFSLIVHDVTEPITIEVDQIYHLACPASPPHYQYNPVKTIKTSTMGTLNMLGLAKRVRARVLLTSTSEIYGDPKISPQHESYWGNVNTIGPRSCYDEGKRVAETMMYSYRNQNSVDVRVARIFNTFGPRMHPNDGRVVSNFIIQSLQNKDMTIYGTGSQTRSFQYVSDLVEGLYALMNGNYDMPVNLGNPDEYSVKDFAEYIKRLTKSESEIVFLPKSQDDPTQRKPDISTASRELGWAPKVKVEEGLQKTIKYFSAVLEQAGEIIPTGPGASKPEA